MIYLELFLTFFMIGACTFGGGYAMLPLMQEQVAATTAEVVITDAEISVSCEDPETVYADLPDGLRLIYREGKYVGWYRPGEEKADEA